MTVAESSMPRGSVPAIWGDVPARNKNFTGRDDILDRLREGASSRVTAVLPESGPRSSGSDPGNPIPQGVHGLGGVGKTAIAIEYAYRYRSDYDLVWWIAADQLPSVRGSLAELAERAASEADLARGEIVLVIAGAAAEVIAQGDDGHAGALDRALKPLLEELPLKQAAHLAARIAAVRDNEAYKRALELKQAYGAR